MGWCCCESQPMINITNCSSNFAVPGEIWFNFVSRRLDLFCACAPKGPATGVQAWPDLTYDFQSSVLCHIRNLIITVSYNGRPILPPAPLDVTMPRLFLQRLATVYWHNCFINSCFRWKAPATIPETLAEVWRIYSSHCRTSARHWSAWHIICMTDTYVWITSPVPLQLPAGHKNGMINTCKFIYLQNAESTCVETASTTPFPWTPATNSKH